jgi:hypothetical protein
MKFFTNSSGAFLLAIATSLFLINWTSPAYMVLPHDPVLVLSLRHLFWLVGGITLVIGLVCLFDDQPTRQMLLLAWLATIFSVYVCGAYWVGCHSLTGYLGGFSQAFGITEKMANSLAMVGVGYLLAVSYGSLLWLWRCKKLEKNFLKMPCPSCGGHIQFAVLNLGDKIACSHCQVAVTLCKPEEDLKTSCYFCKGHIEFPAHALGQKISCPHCKMNITLQQSGVTA